MNNTMDEKTKQQIKEIQRALMKAHPHWPQTKARWLAQISLQR